MCAHRRFCGGLDIYYFSFHVCRHKSLKQRAGVPPGQPASAGQTPQPPTKHKTGEKPEKAEKQQKRPQTPFHHRSSTCEDVALEPDASGQRLALRGPDSGGGAGPAAAARFPGLRGAEVGSVSSKPPQLHGGAAGTSNGGAGGGGGAGSVGAAGPGGSSEMAGSPQPPPLSPHPCGERSEEAPSDALKNPSTPHSQHFYPAPPSSEPCLLPQQKGAPGVGGEEPRLEPLAPPFHPAVVGAYPEPLEPTVYVGAAVSLEEEAGGGAGAGGSHAPWRFFNLPRRKDAEFPTPGLPGDKLREEAALSQDGTVSVTE